MSQADIVHVTRPTDGDVETLQEGSLKEPSEGATIVYRVDGLSTGTESTPATSLSLSGPGIDGERTLAVDGVPASEAESIANAQSGYPRGVDAIVATDSELAALPRSVELEVR